MAASPDFQIFCGAKDDHVPPRRPLQGALATKWRHPLTLTRATTYTITPTVSPPMPRLRAPNNRQFPPTRRTKSPHRPTRSHPRCPCREPSRSRRQQLPTAYCPLPTLPLLTPANLPRTVSSDRRTKVRMGAEPFPGSRVEPQSSEPPAAARERVSRVTQADEVRAADANRTILRDKPRLPRPVSHRPHIPSRRPLTDNSPHFFLPTANCQLSPPFPCLPILHPLFLTRIGRSSSLGYSRRKGNGRRRTISV